MFHTRHDSPVFQLIMNDNSTKILSCDANGELRLDIDTLLQLGDEIFYGKPNTPKTLLLRLECADIYYSNGYFNEALNEYEYVFNHIPWESTGERKVILERAVCGLSAVSQCNDEYVWEHASQIVEGYEIWKRSNEKQA